jgi:uroporphyrinogen decarboxylase
MEITERITRSGRTWVAPLIGYPGARLTRTSVSENLLEAAVHLRSLQALYDRWRMDIVFPMMDLSVEAGALGLPVRFLDNAPATVVEHPVTSRDDLDRLRRVDILSDARLQGFLDVIQGMRSFDAPLVASYVVGPFSLASLLMGASRAAMATVRDPALLHEVLSFATDVVASYACRTRDSGAELVVILEPSGVLLSPESFRVFSGAYVEQLVERISAPCVLHVCGDSSPLLAAMVACGVQGLSLDSPVDLAAAAAGLPESVLLIGNVAPVEVMGGIDEAAVIQTVRSLRESMAGYPNFVLSTGCDLPVNTPWENIDHLMREGRA